MTEATSLEISKEITTRVQTEYLGTRFTVVEFNKWVLRCLEDAADLESHSYYYHKPLKKIRQEGYPLSIFARSGLLPIAEIEPSQQEHVNFDAKVHLNDGTELHVEITCVKDGLFDLVQGEHKEKFGYAGILGVSVEEMRKAIQDGVPNIGDAVDSSETVAACIKDVNERISKKVGKSYPPNTILLVTIEDDFRDSTWKAICSGIQSAPQNTFSSIFLVSVNSKNSAQLC